MKKQILLVLGLGSLLLPGLALDAHAQQRRAAPAAQQDDQPNDQLLPRLHRASKVLGQRIENIVGDNLGTLEELVVHTGEGRVAAVILKWNAANGQLISVNLEDVRLDTAKIDQGIIVVDVDNVSLERAPTVTPGGRTISPELQRQILRRSEVRRAGEAPPRREGGQERQRPDREPLDVVDRLMKASHMIGSTISSEGNDSVGTLSDFLFWIDRGEIIAGILEVEGADNLRAVPWSLLDATRSEGMRIERRHLETLNDAPEFRPTQWRTRAFGFIEQTYQHFGEKLPDVVSRFRQRRDAGERAAQTGTLSFQLETGRKYRYRVSGWQVGGQAAAPVDAPEGPNAQGAFVYVIEVGQKAEDGSANVSVQTEPAAQPIEGERGERPASEQFGWPSFELKVDQGGRIRTLQRQAASGKDPGLSEEMVMRHLGFVFGGALHDEELQPRETYRLVPATNERGTPLMLRFGGITRPEGEPLALFRITSAAGETPEREADEARGRVQIGAGARERLSYTFADGWLQEAEVSRTTERGVLRIRRTWTHQTGR